MTGFLFHRLSPRPVGRTSRFLLLLLEVTRGPDDGRLTRKGLWPVNRLSIIHPLVTCNRHKAKNFLSDLWSSSLPGGYIPRVEKERGMLEVP